MDADESLEVEEVVQPIINYLVTLLGLLKGYEEINTDQIKELELEYYKAGIPEYMSAVLLQSLNILDMTERVLATKGEE